MEPAIFQTGDATYTADTCEPLKHAAREGEVHLRGWGRASYPGIPLPARMLPEVRSIGVWDASLHQSWGLPMHCNEGIELTFLARGQVAFKVDGREWSLRKGQLTITRPWQFHQVGSPNVTPSRLYWLILDVAVRRPNQQWRWPDWLICSPDELAELTMLLRHNEQPVWQASEAVTHSFERLAALLEDGTPARGETKLKLYINDLIIATLDMLRQKDITLDEHLSSTHRAVELFLERLPRHAGYGWDLNTMAQQCGLSRSQFSAYCKQITNMTPIEYLTHCRVEAAAGLLRAEPGLSITEVAFRCGFNSSQYFASVFRAHQGCAPTAYRTEALVPDPAYG